MAKKLSDVMAGMGAIPATTEGRAPAVVPPAVQKKYRFCYFFDIYNAERLLGTKEVTVVADTEDEAMVLAVLRVDVKDAEGFRYTGRWTKAAIA